MVLLICIQLIGSTIPFFLQGKPLFTLIDSKNPFLVFYTYYNSFQIVGLASYLLITIMVGISHLGINIGFISIASLKRKATLLNTLVVCSFALLLSAPSVIHFISLLFRNSVQFSSFFVLINSFEKGRTMSRAMQNSVLPLGYLALSGASILTLIIQWIIDKKKRKKYRERSSWDDSSLFIEWNQLKRFVNED